MPEEQRSPVAAISEVAAAFLDRQRVAHLATSDATGRPHVVPVCFARIGSAVYVAIDEKPKQVSPRGLRRVRNVLANPRASLVADVYDEDWSRLGFVMVEGSTRLLEEGEEHGAALRALRERYPQYRSMALEQRPVLALRVEHVTHWGRLEA